jgi:hypothetical protein
MHVVYDISDIRFSIERCRRLEGSAWGRAWRRRVGGSTCPARAASGWPQEGRRDGGWEEAAAAAAAGLVGGDMWGTRHRSKQAQR